MFDNLLFQNASALLIEDIRHNQLPQSLLFCGREGSGKLTAALELARVLSCEALDEKGLWLCTCPSCLRHKCLSHCELLLMGPRDCILEIQAAKKTFSNALTLDASYKQAAHYLFIRSIRKLSARFNPILWENDEAKLQKAASLLADIDELLEEIHPLRPIRDIPKAEKTVCSLMSAAEKLDNSFLYDSVPVSHVRCASAWARVSPAGRKKVLIIENADKMQESARNAFLKILEEPPKDAVFILLTDRRGAVLQTILSRVRTYPFIDRSVKCQQEVISRVFHDEPSSYTSIQQYIYSFLPISTNTIRHLACLFVHLVLARAVDEGRKPSESISEAANQVLQTTDCEIVIHSVSDISTYAKNFEVHIVFRLFLQHIISLLRSSLRQNNIQERDHLISEKWVHCIQKALEHVTIFNQTPNAALEVLFQDLKDAV